MAHVEGSGIAATATSSSPMYLSPEFPTREIFVDEPVAVKTRVSSSHVLFAVKLVLVKIPLVLPADAAIESGSILRRAAQVKR
jgi:hypothetical protein